MSNDSGVLTEHDPGTVRGADICFYPYTKLPPGPLGTEYLSFPPDVAFEVLSPDDRPVRVMRKIREYLAAGVLAVVILDPEDREIDIHRQAGQVETLGVNDTLTIPEIAPDFSIRVEQLFS